MTFEEFRQLPSSEENRMLIQCLAIISSHPQHQDKSLDQIFAFVVDQAEKVEKEPVA